MNAYERWMGLLLLSLAWQSLPAGAGESGDTAEAAWRRAQPQIQALERALQKKDEKAIQTAVTEATAALGAFVGVPESEAKRFTPTDTKSFPLGKVRQYWERELAHLETHCIWQINPDGDPTAMQEGLRVAAAPVLAAARSAAWFPQTKELLLRQARAGGDWLIARQHPTGLFPFPVGPTRGQAASKSGAAAAKTARTHPEFLQNGWLIDDGGSGALLYDTGLCGSALIELWQATGDAKYLAAAKTAGDWARKRPLSVNWNYNAFSASLLVRLYEATQEAVWLEAALEITRLGILPGQLPSGRWFDPHNAQAVYHEILLRSLLDVRHALPAGHVFLPRLDDSIRRGLDLVARETIAQGSTGKFSGCFARGLLGLGEQRLWRDALNVELNAAAKGGPAPSLFCLAILELAASRGVSRH